VSAIIAQGIVPSALELLDDRTIDAVEASVYAAGYPRDARAVLLIELDGAELAVERERERIDEILRAQRTIEVRVARDEAERLALWRGRKGAFGAMGRLAPDLYVHDAVVPRSRLPDVVEAINREAEARGVRIANILHAGDGNLHPNLSFDRRDPEQLRTIRELGGEILRSDRRGRRARASTDRARKRDYVPDVLRVRLEPMCCARAFDPGDCRNPAADPRRGPVRESNLRYCGYARSLAWARLNRRRARRATCRRLGGARGGDQRPRGTSSRRVCAPRAMRSSLSRVPAHQHWQPARHRSIRRARAHRGPST
jgi:hypothetical protein